MAARKRNQTVDTTKLEMQQPSDIIVPGTGPIVRENEEIAIIDTPMSDKHVDALAFNEEVLEIQLQPSSEENAPQIIDVYVNGEPRWLRVGVIERVKRKFVEVLIRAKPISVQTATGNATAWLNGDSSAIDNRVIRNMRAKYPLTIMSDPSPVKGREWLNRVMAEL